ncbi:MAG: hypothetical protein M0Z31_08635 [Clostridia bacterium]|nr:hypothetical protein [Clostridia bacterium]
MANVKDVQALLNQINHGLEQQKGQDFNLNLTPGKILVILGLLTNVLELDSIEIDSEQAVFISLVGSLKRKATTDKMLDYLGGKSFDEVLQALLRRK